MLIHHLVDTVCPHSGNAAHAVEVREGSRLLFLNGQVGSRRDDTVPASFREQAEIVFERIADILKSADMTLADVARFTVYLTDRADRDDFFAIRDRVMGEHKPGATILIISGLAREEMKLEVETVAARAA